MKKIIHRDFNDIRNATLDTGGRDDIPRQRRAGGGKIEMRSSGAADTDHDQPRGSKRRAAGGRSRTKSKSAVISGAHPKHRADKRARGEKRLASGGSSNSGGSGLSLGSLPGGIPWIPQIAITPGHGAPNPPAIPADQSAQQIAAFANAIGKANSGGSGSNANWSPDLGYLVVNNGQPVGIRGVGPIAGGPDDISAQKHGGRVRNKHSRRKQQRTD